MTQSLTHWFTKSWIGNLVIIKHACVESEIFQAKLPYAIAAHVPEWRSIVIVLVMQVKPVVIFHDEKFQLHAPVHGLHDDKNADMIICFPKSFTTEAVQWPVLIGFQRDEAIYPTQIYRDWSYDL